MLKLFLFILFLISSNLHFAQSLKGDPKFFELYRQVLAREGALEEFEALHDTLVQMQIDNTIDKIRVNSIGKELKFWRSQITEKTYTVKKGDHLWGISARKDTYNDGKKWVNIYNANKNAIVNPNVIYEKQNFKLPGIFEEVSPNENMAELLNQASDGRQIEENIFNLPVTIYESLELQGMVIDNTQSKIGKDFFELFFKFWQYPEESSNHTITISEKPLPRLGSQITVAVNDNEIINQFIQPKYEAIEEFAALCADFTLNYIQNYQLIQNELNGQDIQGSGI
jgi:curli production assembly/transport component CsgE